MITISITSCPSGLRGFISRWLLEIDTGVFVGKASARVRDKLWEQVSHAVRKGSAVMSYAYPNEQGFKVQFIGARWSIEDCDGMALVRHKPA